MGMAKTITLPISYNKVKPTVKKSSSACPRIPERNNLCPPIPVCNDPLNLRLAGLTGNLNFQLFRLKGCPVSIRIDCSGDTEIINGVICNVGTDFVDVRKKDNTVVTVITERICRINWPDPKCNPCVPPTVPLNPCPAC